MMRCTRGSTNEMSCAPLVSSNTVWPASASMRHERKHILLQERFAAGDLDERALERFDRIDDFRQRLLFPFVKGVFRVAIGAAQIAKSQPDKNARPARPGALALNREIDLVNREIRFRHIEM